MPARPGPPGAGAAPASTQPAPFPPHAVWELGEWPSPHCRGGRGGGGVGVRGGGWVARQSPWPRGRSPRRPGRWPALPPGRPCRHCPPWPRAPASASSALVSSREAAFSLECSLQCGGVSTPLHGALKALARFVLKLTCRSSSASTEVSFSSSFRLPWSSFRSVLNSSARSGVFPEGCKTGGDGARAGGRDLGEKPGPRAGTPPESPLHAVHSAPPPPRPVVLAPCFHPPETHHLGVVKLGVRRNQCCWVCGPQEALRVQGV